MKKTLLLLLLVTFIACEKNEPKEPTTATVMINVTFTYDGIDSHIANPTLVRLYKEKASEFDFEKSVSSMASSQNMYLKTVTPANPVYTSDSFSGVNTFKDIDKGNYTAIVFFKPDGYTFSLFYYYAYKEITVSDLKTHNIVFTWNTDKGKFIQK